MNEKQKAMDTVSQGVYLVGTKMGQGFNFMTAAFVTQISFNPCSIALSVANTHYTAQLIREEGSFSLSVLAQGQTAEAKACGYQSGRKTDKSQRVRFHLTEQGLPVVEGASAQMVCTVRQTLVYEDHTVFFAEIASGTCTGETPMVYRQEDFFPQT